MCPTYPSRLVTCVIICALRTLLVSFTLNKSTLRFLVMSVEREQKGKKNEEVCFEQFILLLIGFINKPRRKITMSITYTNKNKNKSGIQDNISSHEKVALL